VHVRSKIFYEIVLLVVYEGALFVNIVFIMLICKSKLTKDVAPCFVLRANRYLVGTSLNNSLRHSASMCKHGTAL
jgi:hypothetical protein